MSNNYKITETISTSPVSVAKLRQHLSLWDDASYDSELRDLLLTATEYVGNHIGSPVSEVSVKMPFKSSTELTLAHETASNILVKYYDATSTLQTLDSENYVVDPTGEFASVIIKSLPVMSPDFQNPIFVTYTTSTEVPSKAINHVILMTAAELFEVRTESTDAKARVAAITINRLLAADKRVVV